MSIGISILHSIAISRKQSGGLKNWQQKNNSRVIKFVIAPCVLFKLGALNYLTLSHICCGLESEFQDILEMLSNLQRVKRSKAYFCS